MPHHPSCGKKQKAAEDKRIEAMRVDLAARLRKQGADLHAAVDDMFPFSRTDCPLFRPGAPR